MVEVDPIKQIRNFKELKQIDAYRKWHKNIRRTGGRIDEKKENYFVVR